MASFLIRCAAVAAAMLIPALSVTAVPGLASPAAASQPATRPTSDPGATTPTATRPTATSPTATRPTAARPTADPAAPTPNAPMAGPPPVGTAPDGRVVGGPLLATRSVVQPAGSPPLPPDINARGWLVADLGSGQVLAAQDPHGRYYPASTLKTLTFLTLFPLLNPQQIVVGTPEDVDVEGSKVGLVDGGQYPVQLLFQALMMQSGNDAANALARAAGGTATTVALMSDRAAAMQAYDTVVGAPSGLDVAGQSSSPYDLALFLRAIVSDPAMLAIMATRTASMPAVPPKYPGFQIQNQNRLLDGYPGDLAGKTGFTDAARHTYVDAADHNGRRLVVTLMDGEQAPVSMPDQAVRLLDWGFSVPPGEGIGTLVGPAPVTAASSGTASSSAASSSPASPGAASPSAASSTRAAARRGGAAPKTVTHTASVPVLAAGVIVAGAALWVVRRRALSSRRAATSAAPPGG